MNPLQIRGLFEKEVYDHVAGSSRNQGHTELSMVRGMTRLWVVVLVAMRCILTSIESGWVCVVIANRLNDRLCG